MLALHRYYELATGSSSVSHRRCPLLATVRCMAKDAGFIRFIIIRSRRNNRWYRTCNSLVPSIRHLIRRVNSTEITQPVNTNHTAVERVKDVFISVFSRRVQIACLVVFPCHGYGMCTSPTSDDIKYHDINDDRHLFPVNTGQFTYTFEWRRVSRLSLSIFIIAGLLNTNSLVCRSVKTWINFCLKLINDSVVLHSLKNLRINRIDMFINVSDIQYCESDSVTT